VEDMSKIHLLDQDTINKIAAGEVVERPVSVIKELVENAVDASSTAITVEIQDGGLKLIRVTDNGLGMNKEDVRQAFLRHATSKIRKASDLEAIGSLGFRGEALASISAVSIVECMTKTKEDIAGIRCVIEGGVEKSFSDIGCPEGTTFVVKDLFFNVPARKKFIKSPRTEAGYVTDLMNRMALSHPGISFKYIVNGKVKLHTSGNYELLDCIYQVFGKEYAKHSKEVYYTKDEITISGYIGEPILSRGNRQYEIYFVNNRYIKSKWIQKGIEEGMKEAMMINQFPFAVLFLDISSSQVDVNVHPNKMDVRFNNESQITEMFKEAVSQGANRHEPVAQVSLHEKEEKALDQKIRSEERKMIKDAPEPFEFNRLKKTLPSTAQLNRKKFPIRENKAERKDSEHGRIYDRPTQPHQKMSVNDNSLLSVESPHINKNEEKRESLDLDHFLNKQQIKKHTIIGQIFKTYWLVQYKEEMYIIDQHAAHEKVLYEAWVDKLSETKVASQMLLEPMVYELSDNEFQVYKRYQEELNQLGFEVEIFGESAIVVKSVPYLLNAPLNDLDFIVFFDQLVSGEASIRKDEQHLQKIASLACKSAIKGNDRLSEIEYRGLIDQLLALKDPYHCPHGRPTMIRMSKYELEKKFRRIV